jgi:hypothetical protein
LIHILLLLGGPSVCTSYGASLMIAGAVVGLLIHLYSNSEHNGCSEYSGSHKKTAGCKTRGGF